jgi:hypothetical protein
MRLRLELLDCPTGRAVMIVCGFTFGWIVVDPRLVQAARLYAAMFQVDGPADPVADPMRPYWRGIEIDAPPPGIKLGDAARQANIVG